MSHEDLVQEVRRLNLVEDSTLVNVVLGPDFVDLHPDVVLLVLIHAPSLPSLLISLAIDRVWLTLDLLGGLGLIDLLILALINFLD